MTAALQNAKGPARTAILPSRGSTNPQKETEMNIMNDNISSSGLLPIARRGFLGGLAVLALPSAASATLAAQKPEVKLDPFDQLQRDTERLKAALAALYPESKINFHCDFKKDGCALVFVTSAHRSDVE